MLIVPGWLPNAMRAMVGDSGYISAQCKILSRHGVGFKYGMLHAGLYCEIAFTSCVSSYTGIPPGFSSGLRRCVGVGIVSPPVG